MESIIAFALPVVIIIGAILLFLSEDDAKSRLEERLANASGLASSDSTPTMSITEQELEKSFFDRVVKPFLDGLKKKDDGKKKKETGMQAEIKKLLGQAGMHGQISVDQFMMLHGLCAGFFVISGPIIAKFILHLQGSKLLYGCLIPALIGYLGPKMYLINKAKARVLKIQKTLPDTLDLLVVAVDAGLGFDQAISKVCEKMKGPIPDEFRIVLKQTQLGLARKDALREMANRIDQAELSSFVGAIIQAAELGVGIGQVLRVQSDQLKVKKKQRAEEAANKVPVMMMVPMVFFIFPTVFVVILAPAVFQIYIDMIAK